MWYCRLIGRTPAGVASTATLTPSFTPADAAGRLVLLLLGATCTAILPDVVDANTGILPGPRLTVPDLSAGYYPFPLYNEDRGMVILSFPLYSPEAGTIYLPFPLVAPNEVPALLEGPRSVEQSINDMLLLATYGQAKHALQQGATEVKVSTRAEAEQLFYELFVVGDPRHYRNTTGMTSAEANRFFGTRAGTYHWDEDLSRHLNEEHSKYPHLQIHTFEGDIIRIYFEKVD